MYYKIVNHITRDGVALTGLSMHDCKAHDQIMCKLCYFKPLRRDLLVEPTESVPLNGCKDTNCRGIDIYVPDAMLDKAIANIEKLEAECHTQS